MIHNLKQRIEQFTHAKFNGATQKSENEYIVFVENTETGSIYSINAVVISEDFIIFDTKNQENIFESEDSHGQQIGLYSEILEEVFDTETKESGIEKLKEFVRSFHIKDQKTITENVKTLDTKCIFESVQNEYTEMVEVYNKYLTFKEIFNENNELKEGFFLDRDSLYSMISELKELSESFFEGFDSFVDTKELLVTLTESDEAAEYILNGLFKKENPAKLLVYAKHNFNEDINIPQLTSQLQEISEGFDIAFGSADNEKQLAPAAKFAPLHFGKFSRDNLTTIWDEIDKAMNSLKVATAEDMQFLNDAKNKIDFMLRKDIICDEAVASILKSLTSRFSKDDKEQYYNATGVVNDVSTINLDAAV